MNITYEKALSTNVGRCSEEGHEADEAPYPVLVVTLRTHPMVGYAFRFCEAHWNDARPVLRYVPEWYDAGWPE